MRRIYRKLLCPAKVNLILRVGPRRADGFHDLESWMMKLAWGDELSLSVEEAKMPSISLKSSFAMPRGENLVERAFKAFCCEFKVSLRAEAILVKRVPTGAGLGGGSSDAATMLMALADFVGAGVSRKRLMGVAATLGSDVPFFLGSTSSWCEGRGERLTALHNAPSFHFVLVFPTLSVSTPWAYGALDRFRENHAGHRRGSRGREEGRGSAGRGNFLKACPEWLAAHCASKRTRGGREAGHGGEEISKEPFIPDLFNDFESPVFAAHPELEACLQKIRESGAVVARMSGSGSTVFGLYGSQRTALDALKLLKHQGLRAIATQTLKSSWPSSGPSGLF